MRKITRDDWIGEGLRVLAAEGDASLTVDGVCERLGRSKGSFYHHFAGRAGYVTSLLEAWEKQTTDRLIAAGRGPGSVEERLREVNRQASELRSARLERAIRSWGAREPLAARAQDRIDGRRLAFLEQLCGERMGDGEPARRMARVLQLVYVGAQHLDPPVEGSELYATFRFLDALFDVRGER